MRDLPMVKRVKGMIKQQDNVANHKITADARRKYIHTAHTEIIGRNQDCCLILVGGNV